MWFTHQARRDTGSAVISFICKAILRICDVCMVAAGAFKYAVVTRSYVFDLLGFVVAVNSHGDLAGTISNPLKPIN